MPDSPDYDKLIPIQSAEDRRTLQYTLDQQRVRQESPYGSQYWTKEADADGTPQWTYRQELSPEQQRLYDADMASKLQQSDLLQGAAGRVQDQMAKPLDISNAAGWSGSLQSNIDPNTGLPRVGSGVTAADPTALQPGGAVAPGQQAQWRDTQARSPDTGFNQQLQAPSSVGRLGESQSAQVGAVGSAGMGANGGRTNQVAETLYNQQMRFLQPEQERASESLRGQLIQSGFQEGSEAYERERNRLEQQQGLLRADARDRAIMAAGQEDSRQFGQDIASSQFLQGLAGQRDAQELARFGANLGATGQEFGQEATAMGFNRETADDRWQRGLMADQQAFQQDATRFGLDAGQSVQDFQQRLASQQFAGSQQAQQFQQQQALQEMQAARTQQEYQQALQRYQASLAGSNAQFQQQQAAGTFNNQMRNQQILEAMMLRQFPLNELNALRTGAQVNLPNNQAQYSSPELKSQDYIGAAEKTYQNQMDQYNAKAQEQQALMSGLMGMGASFLTGGMASDRRLKEGIRFLGMVGDLPLYAFRYLGGVVEWVGYMAQDLLTLRPEAVTQDADGYYRVDYSKV